MPVKKLREILVPKCSSQGVEYPLEHHHKWDEKAREIAGGITILKSAKGQWISQKGKLFIEGMIPVRIHCTEEEIDKIMEHTLAHYDQEAIFAYEISSNVKVKYRKM